MNTESRAKSSPIPIEADRFRSVLSHLPTGACVVTSTDDAGGTHGISCNSFTSVSLSPPLVGFLPARSSTTWPLMRSARRFAINVLAENQHDLCRQFSLRNVDRFAGVDWTSSPLGNPLLPGTVAWLDCQLYDEHPAGDHTFVLGAVAELSALGNVNPLIFFRGSFGRLAEAVAAAQ